MMLARYKHVSSDDMWLTDNPGRQQLLTGSFHPLSNSIKIWTSGAYMLSSPKGSDGHAEAKSGRY
ncbi:unnamed protein product [Choristocarpus tenellus]